MERRQISEWREPHELENCKEGTEVYLYFSEKQQYGGIFRGIDDDAIKLQSINSDTVIGLPIDKLSAWCISGYYKPLEFCVYPSILPTISVEDDPIYGGAHSYAARNSRGFEGGEAIYDDDEQEVKFVHKRDDGTVIPGLQSEQLAYILLDRCEKLNARFPSEYNAKMIEGLKMFISACEDRVKDRIERGVMGKLKE